MDINESFELDDALEDRLGVRCYSFCNANVWFVNVINCCYAAQGLRTMIHVKANFLCRTRI